MNAKSNKQDKTIIVQMTCEEAEWLKALLMNPVNVRFSQDEKDFDKQNRYSIFSGLMTGTSQSLTFASEESAVGHGQADCSMFKRCNLIKTSLCNKKCGMYAPAG